MAKHTIIKDQWYPVYSIYDGYPGVCGKEVDMPEDLLNEYNKVIEEMCNIQNKLRDLYEK